MKVAHWSHVLQAMRYDEWSEMARNATADGYQVMLQHLDFISFTASMPSVHGMETLSRPCQTHHESREVPCLDLA